MGSVLMKIGEMTHLGSNWPNGCLASSAEEDLHRFFFLSKWGSECKLDRCSHMHGWLHSHKGLMASKSWCGWLYWLVNAWVIKTALSLESSCSASTMWNNNQMPNSKKRHNSAQRGLTQLKKVHVDAHRGLHCGDQGVERVIHWSQVGGSITSWVAGRLNDRQKWITVYNNAVVLHGLGALTPTDENGCVERGFRWSRTVCVEQSQWVVAQ